MIMKNIFLMFVAIALHINVFGQENCNFEKLKQNLVFFKSETFLKDFEIALDQKTKVSTKTMVLSAGVKYGFEVVMDASCAGDVSFSFLKHEGRGDNLKKSLKLYLSEYYFPELRKLNGKAHFEYVCTETAAYMFEINLKAGASACCVMGIYFLGQSLQTQATNFSEDSVYTKVDLTAEYLGGFSKLGDDIRAELKRNKIVSKKGSSVIINLIVASNGKISSVKFAESPGKQQEIIVKNLIYSKTWTPAYLRGRPVKQALTIQFQLD